MPINFPDSPALNDTFTAGGRTWKWDGTVWQSVTAVAAGPTGPTGAPGTPGGPTGPTGANGATDPLILSILYK
jgi:hypothetical protein